MPLDPGKLYRPTDITVDVLINAVYVVEQFNHRISKWNYTPGLFDFTLDVTWGSNNDGTSGEGGPIGDGGPDDNSLYRPTGITLETGGILVVTDTFHNRIRTLGDGTGEFIDSVGQGGSGLSDFYHPRGIANSGISLVVADELNHRGVKYTLGTTPSDPIIVDNPTPLGYNRPVGVTQDPNNNHFNISDTYHGVINKYGNVGTGFQDQYGSPGTLDDNVNLFFPGSGDGTLTDTTTIAFADTKNNAIKTLTSIGGTSTLGLTTADVTTPNAGKAGTGDGQLYYPGGVLSFEDGATGYVLAANTLNNRIEVYSNSSTVLTFESNFGTP